jgi:hypothetical protein
LRAVKKYADKPGECNSKHFGPASITLRRVDLFCCYCLKRPEQVTSLISHLYALLGAEKRGFISKYGTRYLRFGFKTRSGRHIAFYDKSHEIASKLRVGESEDTGIPEGTLKVELRLEHDELKKLGLNELKAWTEHTPAEVFQRYVGEVIDRVSMVIPVAPVPWAVMQKLPWNLRPPYAVKALGGDLEKIYSESSVRRYKKAFLEKGVVVTGGKTRTLRVSRILSAKRAFKRSQLPRTFRARFKLAALKRDHNKKIA